MYADHVNYFLVSVTFEGSILCGKVMLDFFLMKTGYDILSEEPERFSNNLVDFESYKRYVTQNRLICWGFSVPWDNVHRGSCDAQERSIV